MSVEQLKFSEITLIASVSGILTSSCMFLYKNKIKPVLLSGSAVFVWSLLGLGWWKKYRILNKPIQHDARERYNPQQSHENLTS